ncbi:beta-ketoacyl synthase chain length factor [Shewanella gaetbuli]
MQLAFDILSWSAWTPDFQTKESWLTWQQPNHTTEQTTVAPKLAQIPAMQRRRFSRLTKMMLSVALDCQVSTNTRSIFASRHGELNRTIGLLEDIVIQQPLSPMAFSQSVHNTGSGIFGITAKNKASSTSIAAGTQSMPQGLIEAYAQLDAVPSPVLFIYSDDPIPPVYNQYINEVELPIALGMQLVKATTNANPNSVARLIISTDTSNDQSPDICLSQFIHHLASNQSLQGNMRQWHWMLTTNE